MTVRLDPASRIRNLPVKLRMDPQSQALILFREAPVLQIQLPMLKGIPLQAYLVTLCWMEISSQTPAMKMALDNLFPTPHPATMERWVAGKIAGIATMPTLVMAMESLLTPALLHRMGLHL